MPKCSYCNRIFNDRQALGNHMRKHTYDSDDEYLPSQNSQNQMVYSDSQNPIDISTPNFRDQSLPNENMETNDQENSTGMQHFDVHLTSTSDMSDDNSLNTDSLALLDVESVESNEEPVKPVEEPIESDDESVASDLSYITDVSINEYIEYDAIFNETPDDLIEILQEFPSEEYAEFMYMITRFRVPDSLGNAFIQFFNKYSKRNDKPLPSTTLAGRIFMENLQLPNFGWRRETIFEYKEREYIFEYRTVLDGIQQILTNKNITEDFIFKYKSSIENVNTNH
ncbi:unnamed protein product [Rhizophagus irregularis]|uniref:C2H2-type domain-containing protein n=1 Tax=Rhizophagus irregularis TaxID=588596 RepID=A0A916ECN2_9GLOM|nr:unnamed protein product [Rhizophagus irregularis]